VDLHVREDVSIKEEVREETDITGTQVDQKIQVEESSEQKIESSISVDLHVREDVSIKEEVTEAWIRKSMQAPKIEKVDSMIGTSAVELDSMKKKRTFRKFSYRGVDLDQLLDLSLTQLMELFTCRVRRKLSRGLRRKPMALLKKLRRAKKAAEVNEKPEVVKTHLRNMVVLPEMVGSIIGVYNGKVFTQVEVKPEMIGHYLGEFSISYKPVKHGRPGIGATHSSRFIPLK